MHVCEGNDQFVSFAGGKVYECPASQASVKFQLARERICKDEYVYMIIRYGTADMNRE
ncbi:MAG: hypothetical protein IKN93_01700 [Bacteroidales bacterium]|nr:hypothetical protein [Bacteroidales bacterium]